jgi:type I restriction enzyme S subunit
MTTGNAALPTGWVPTSLGEVAHVEAGQSPSSSSFTADETAIAFLQGNAEFGETFPTPVKRTTEPSKFASDDAVLVSVRAPVGAMNLSPTRLAIGRGLAAIESSPEMDRRFLLWLLRYKRQELEQQATGTTFPAITGKVLRSLPLDLPPAPEQARIVEAIESHIAFLRTGTTRISEAVDGLAVFRASVVVAALRGELQATSVPDDAQALLNDVLARRGAQWEQDELQRIVRRSGRGPRTDDWKKRYPEPMRPDPPANAELPAGWCWATVDQLSTMVQYGSSAKTNDDASGIPVLRMGNIQDGRLVLGSLKYLPRDHAEFPDLHLAEGDLLFNRTNSPELVGKAAVARELPAPCSFASYLIRVRFADGVLPEWVSYYLRSAYGRAWVRSVVTQQVGQANVNGTKLRALTVPLPPLDVQRALVEAVERYMEAARALETRLVGNLRQAVNLERAVLHAAFSGALSTQSSVDEPAELLLERLSTFAAEHGRAAKARRNRARAKATVE